MQRREFVAGSGIAFGAALGGCLADDPDPTGDGNGNGDGSGDGGSGNENGSDGRSVDPGGPPESYPDYGDDVDRTIGHEAAEDDAPLSLTPSTDAIEPGESVTFALTNRSEETFRTNFFAWRIHRWVGGEWFHVAPRGWNQPLMSLDPGETHEWTVTVENDAVLGGEPVPWTSGTESVTVHGLGGGWYAFGAGGWFESADHESKTAVSARFEVDAPRLDLTPTNAIEGTEWEGETLVAHSTRGDPDDEHYRLGAYELERVDEPGEDPRRVIAEQAIREHQLRDTLALVREHDADRVRLEEYDATTPIFGSRTDGRYEYRGQYYEVTTREL